MPDKISLLKLLAAKDLRLIFRQSGYIWIAIIFYAGALLLFKLSTPLKNFNPQLFETNNLGLIEAWYQEKLLFILALVILLHTITAVFLLMANYEWDLKDNAIRYLQILGIDPQWVFWSKTLVISFCLILLWVFEIAITFFLIGQDLLQVAVNPNLTAKIFEMGSEYFAIGGSFLSVSMAIVGQITAVISFHSRFKLSLMLILFIPLCLPLFIICTRFLADFILLTEPPALSEYGPIMGAYLAIYFAVVYMLYSVLWQE